MRWTPTKLAVATIQYHARLGADRYNESVRLREDPVAKPDQADYLIDAPQPLAPEPRSLFSANHPTRAKAVRREPKLMHNRTDRLQSLPNYQRSLIRLSRKERVSDGTLKGFQRHPTMDHKNVRSTAPRTRAY